MEKTALPLTKTDPVVPVRDLARYIADWPADCQIRQHSPRTVAGRRIITNKLLKFLKDRGYESCGTSELRDFFSHLRQGHEEPNGRWGNPRLRQPVRPCTAHMYHSRLQAFFNWLVNEGVVPVSPMQRIKAPLARADQVQPFTQDQITSLYQAAQKSRNPRRDAAIVLFLLDTGVRASELCGIKMKDVDLDGRNCRVLGKGNKYRTIYFGRNTAKALWQYLREMERRPDEPLFLSDRGRSAGEPLTRYGLRQLIERLGKAAKIQATRCSSHTFRHTFAVEFLRNGGHIFTLKEMLGHTSLQIVNRYVALAQADIENQHRQFSPGDRIKRSLK
jgi:site-specific recombinase XerD